MKKKMDFIHIIRKIIQAPGPLEVVQHHQAADFSDTVFVLELLDCWMHGTAVSFDFQGWVFVQYSNRFHSSQKVQHDTHFMAAGERLHPQL
jgi:hypothetical protein